MIIHGDCEAAVLDILRNDSPELPHYPPNPPLHISTNYLGYAVGQRRIIVTQEGASMKWPKISRARIDIEVLAERRTVAKEIIEICIASVFRQMGDYRGFGLFISDIKLEQGATRIADKLQEGSRYVCALRLTVVPSPPGLSVPAS